MAIKTYKPTTPGRRGMTALAKDEITKQTPERSLTVSFSKTGGRNNTGRITTRHHGGGHKQLYVSSISRETRMTFQQKLLLSNTIQTEMPISLCFTMLMAKRDISSLLRA